MSQSSPSLGRPTVNVYTVPTDAPEADGTLQWSSTTLVVVGISAGGTKGIGFTYAHSATASVVSSICADALEGTDPFDIPKSWHSMVHGVRNVGWSGIAAAAISACDIALWDLKARLLEQPLARLLGMARPAVGIYGSGGFTSYSDDQLAAQLARWVGDYGCRAVKMKVGSAPQRDPARLRIARAATGDAELYVDANGAFTPRQAREFARTCSEFGVTWFEEPVSSDDLRGLREVRLAAPDRMDIAAGEYGYTPHYFRTMLEAQAVDVIQADATRCGGITGFLKAGEIADAFMRPLSAHTAPSLHLHAACAAPRFKNIEWFHDHARIERMLFDGAPEPEAGTISPDFTRPGLGLSLRTKDAERYAA